MEIHGSFCEGEKLLGLRSKVECIRMERGGDGRQIYWNTILEAFMIMELEGNNRWDLCNSGVTRNKEGKE